MERIGRRRLGRFLAVVMLLGMLLPVRDAVAQGPISSATYAEDVSMEPTRARLRPGASQAFVVTGTSRVNPPVIAATIPAGLSVLGTPACSTSALVYPFGSGPERSRPDTLHCNLSVETRQDGGGTLITGTSTQTNQQLVAYSIELHVTVQAPPDATPGVLYSITAPVAVPIGTTEVASVEILDAHGGRVTPLLTPTPFPVTPPTEAANASYGANPPSVPNLFSVQELTVNPSLVQAEAGSTVTLDVLYPRLQGVHSIAFLASADGSAIVNIGRANVVLEGDAACLAGHEGDIVPPGGRDQALGQGYEFPPNNLEVVISGESNPGDRVRVCVEVVGFALDQELFAWNEEAIIEIVP